MVQSKLRRPFACPSCGATTRAPMLCSDCFEAFMSSRGSHPSGGAPLRVFPQPVLPDVHVAHDLDLWDAWALLGDVGDGWGSSPSR